MIAQFYIAFSMNLTHQPKIMHRKLIIPLSLALIITAAYCYQQYDAEQQGAALEKARAERLAEIHRAYETEVPEATKRKDFIYQMKQAFVELPPSYTALNWLMHTQWAENVNNNMQNALAVQVSENGEMSLVSRYAGEEPLQHTQLRVEIGSQVYDSTFVPNTAGLPVIDYKTKGVSFKEELTFSSSQDIAIIKAIAQSKAQKIQVKLLGYNRFEEFTLSEEDVQAIKESWQLAEVLRS